MSSPKRFSLKEYLSSRQGQIMVILILIFIFVLFGAVPKTIQEQNAKRFGKPLFEHLLPEGSSAIQTYAQQARKDGVTSTFAAIILRSSQSEEELLAFFGDVEYPPALKGDEVSLKVLPLQEDALTVLKNNGLYEEGSNYWYIYLYSAPPEE